MKTFKALTVVVLSAGLLVACTGTTTNMADASTQPTPSSYSIIDSFKDPSGNAVVLYCRNGHLYVSKDGSREGSLQFFYRHEMCAGR